MKHEKGVNHMCQLMEEYTKDARAEGKAEGKAEGLLLGKIEIYYNDVNYPLLRSIDLEAGA